MSEPIYVQQIATIRRFVTTRSPNGVILRKAEGIQDGGSTPAAGPLRKNGDALGMG